MVAVTARAVASRVRWRDCRAGARRPPPPPPPPVGLGFATRRVPGHTHRPFTRARHRSIAWGRPRTEEREPARTQRGRPLSRSTHLAPALCCSGDRPRASSGGSRELSMLPYSCILPARSTSVTVVRRVSLTLYLVVCLFYSLVSVL